MAETKRDLVKARWLGGPSTLATDGTKLEHGTEVPGIPRGEAEASDNWEIVAKSKSKESDE